MTIIRREHIHSTGRFAPTGISYRTKKFKEAEKVADREEKKLGKKKFEKLKRIERKLPRGELLGKVTHSGNIIISKRVPKTLEKNVKVHERALVKALRTK